jgi:hypothetical protein
MIYKKVTFFIVFYYAKITSDMETDIPECYKRLEYVRMLYDKSYAPQYNSNPGIYAGYIHIQYTFIVGGRA